jgi:hypothetical protein
MNNLLIIGGASLDRLHFSGQTAQAAGGAGMYTAAAAHRLGASVTMFAPRPEPMPKVLQPLEDRIEWIGPVVAPEDLPRFEIAHHGHGSTELKAAMCPSSWATTAWTSPWLSLPNRPEVTTRRASLG